MLKAKLYLTKAAIILLPFFGILLLLHFTLPKVAREYSREKFGQIDLSEHESKHFRIYTKQIPLSAEKIGLVAEEFFLAFQKTYGKQLNYQGLRNIIEIFFFGKREEFDNYYENRFHKELPNNAAYYNPVNGKIVLYWTNLPQSKQTLYHEMTHMIWDQALGAYNPAWSFWLNEGFATYIEQCSIQNGEIVPAEFNIEIRDLIKKAYEDRNFIPLEELCRSSHEDFQGERNYLYYYESYLFVFFLLHAEEGKYEKSFYSYIEKEITPGSCPPHLLWAELGKSPSELENAFLRFFQIDMLR